MNDGKRNPLDGMPDIKGVQRKKTEPLYGTALILLLSVLWHTKLNKNPLAERPLTPGGRNRRLNQSRVETSSDTFIIDILATRL